MHWISHYLDAEYEDGAREWLGKKYDCWALCREVRFLHCGARLLPSWGHVRNTMPRLFTRAYRAEAASMEVCKPEPGAIAAVFRGALMVHVGVCIEIDGRVVVLEMNPKTGVRWRRIHDFEAPYARVVYYRDKKIQEQ